MKKFSSLWIFILSLILSFSLRLAFFELKLYSGGLHYRFIKLHESVPFYGRIPNKILDYGPIGLGILIIFALLWYSYSKSKESFTRADIASCMIMAVLGNLVGTFGLWLLSAR